MVGVGTTVVTVKSDPQKAKKAIPKVAKAKVAHPPTSEMVTNAIKALKQRGGSSLPAIKKYLAGNYAVDADKLAPFIKKFLKSAVLSGVLIQTRGKGATGSFKLSKISGKPEKMLKSIEAAKVEKVAAPKNVAKKEGKEKEKAIEPKTQSPASPKKVEKKKATKPVKKSNEVKSKETKKKAIKPVTATLNTSKVVKPKKAATAKKSVKKAAKK